MSDSFNLVNTNQGFPDILRAGFDLQAFVLFKNCDSGSGWTC